MKIDRMEKGALYTIKTSTVITDQFVPVTDPSKHEFIYLGWKQEDWTYSCQNTNKIHYVLWRERVWVMDNQFAKHIEPVWSEDCNGQD